MHTVPEQDRLLTPAEAADLLGVDSAEQVAALADAGHITADAGRRGYDAASVAAYAARRTANPDSTPTGRPLSGRPPTRRISDRAIVALIHAMTGVC